MLRLTTTAVFVAIFIAFASSDCKATDESKISKPEKDGKAVAEIGSEKITVEELDEMIKDVPEEHKATVLNNKELFLENVINQKLLHKAALSRKLDKDAQVQKQAEEATRQIIINEYLRREIGQKVFVTDEDVKTYYDANKDKLKEPAKIRASHILVDSESEAKDILAKLGSGADFAALAKEKSKCPSKEKGGDLGFFSRGQMVPEFEAAAFSIQVGQLSDVIKTQFGYHIIKVEEKIPERELSFDEIKDRLKQMLLADKQRERLEVLLKELKDKNKVVIYKEVLQPAVNNELNPPSAGTN